MAKKNKPIDPDEVALFRKHMTGATPLKSNRVVPANKPASPNPAKNHARQPEPIDSQPLHFRNDMDANHSLFFSRGGLQHKVLKRLKRGEIGIEARLDLHGCILANAEKKLLAFLHNAQVQENRCVLVIHGRGLRSEQGRPVLKQAVDQWLRQIPAVLAYASALPEHGGLGAVYVILKKSAKD